MCQITGHQLALIGDFGREAASQTSLPTAAIMSRTWQKDVFYRPFYLYDQCSQNDGAEDGIVEDAIKNVPLAMNLASIELVKDLHEDEGVEDNGVVLSGRGVKRGVSSAVNVKHLLTCKRVSKA